MRTKDFLFLIFIILALSGCVGKTYHSSYNNKSAAWQDSKSHEAIKELNKQLPN